jgi:RNA polymerase sigma-70 factor (ECF subfamily)
VILVFAALILAFARLSAPLAPSAALSPRPLAPAYELRAAPCSPAGLAPLALPLTARRRSRSGQRPASTRGRTWRLALRPLRGIRRSVFAAGRRSKAAPPGGAPPAVPPPAPAPLGADITPEDLAWLLGQYRWIVAVLWKLHVPDADAEDVAQETLTSAMKSWRTFRGNELPQRVAWLNTIARRHAWDYHKAVAHNPARPGAAGEGNDASVPSSEDAIDARRTLGILQRATTPERWRAFVAHDAEGETAAEIATREGVPVQTVYNRLRAARLDIAAALARNTRVRRTRRDERARAAAKRGSKRARKAKE